MYGPRLSPEPVFCVGVFIAISVHHGQKNPIDVGHDFSILRLKWHKFSDNVRDHCRRNPFSDKHYCATLYVWRIKKYKKIIPYINIYFPWVYYSPRVDTTVNENNWIIFSEIWRQLNGLHVSTFRCSTNWSNLSYVWVVCSQSIKPTMNLKDREIILSFNNLQVCT